MPIPKRPGAGDSGSLPSVDSGADDFELPDLEEMPVLVEMELQEQESFGLPELQDGLSPSRYERDPLDELIDELPDFRTESSPTTIGTESTPAAEPAESRPETFSEESLPELDFTTESQSGKNSEPVPLADEQAEPSSQELPDFSDVFQDSLQDTEPPKLEASLDSDSSLRGSDDFDPEAFMNSALGDLMSEEEEIASMDEEPREEPEESIAIDDSEDEESLDDWDFIDDFEESQEIKDPEENELDRYASFARELESQESEANSQGQLEAEESWEEILPKLPEDEPETEEDPTEEEVEEEPENYEELPEEEELGEAFAPVAKNKKAAKKKPKKSWVRRFAEFLLKPLSMIPVIGKLFSLLLKFSFAFGILILVLPLLILPLVFHAIAGGTLTGETTVSFPDSGSATMESMSYNPDNGEVTANVTNTGDVIADITPSFVVWYYEIAPFDPTKWFSYQQLGECTGEMMSVEIDATIQTNVSCELNAVPGVSPKVTGKLIY